MRIGTRSFEVLSARRVINWWTKLRLFNTNTLKASLTAGFTSSGCSPDIAIEGKNHIDSRGRSEGYKGWRPGGVPAGGSRPPPPLHPPPSMSRSLVWPTRPTFIRLGTHLLYI